MNIFGVYPVDGLLDGTYKQIAKGIEDEPENKILNYDETAYIEYLVSEFSFDLIEFDWEAVYTTSREEIIPAHRHPPGYDVRHGARYCRPVITYHIPYRGDSKLFTFSAGEFGPAFPEAETTPNEVTFDIIAFGDDPESIERKAGQVNSLIQRKHSDLDSQLIAFNESIESFALPRFRARKQRILERLDLQASLTVPIKRTRDTPGNITVPIPKRRIEVPKPDVSDAPYEPEYEMEYTAFETILRACLDAGASMERSPEAFRDHHEESLRDWLLTILSSHFDNASGETFNLKGKTDILVRHEGTPLFVAECKFWGGKKKYLEAIDQTLSYLTWRDSKVAIVIFVRNKDFGSVLNTVASETPSHPCFVGAKDSKGENRFDFRFHLPGDSSRGVDLSVLCFHLPKT